MAKQLTRRQRKAQAEAHPIAWVLRQLVAQVGSVEGSSTQWLQLLNDRAADHLRQSRAWLTTASHLGVLFGELSEGLELLGVVLSFRRSNGVRLWRCETAEIAAQRRHFAANEEQIETAKRARECEEKALLKQIRARHRVLDSQRERKTR